jgi:membrane protein YqaA with SNARE-associated domain
MEPGRAPGRGGFSVDFHAPMGEPSAPLCWGVFAGKRSAAIDEVKDNAPLPDDTKEAVWVERQIEKELAKPVPKWAIHRRVYHWVLRLAERPHAMVALFVLAYFEAFFLPVPVEALLFPLVLGHRKNWWKFALVAGTASILGGSTGYLVGYAIKEPVRNLCLALPWSNPEAWDRFRAWYDQYGFAAVFVAGWTPIPYNVCAVSSGILDINYGIFLCASLVSRYPRFFVLALLLWRFGHKIKPFIDRWFNWICIISVALIVGFIWLLPHLAGGQKSHSQPESRPATQAVSQPADQPEQP